MMTLPDTLAGFNDTADSRIPITSTPWPCYQPSTQIQGRKRPCLEFDAWVSDGRALRTLEIKSDMTFFVLLSRAAEIMKLTHTSVTLGYEAPWCKKSGQKMQLRYLENDRDLADMMKCYENYMKEQRQKKSRKTAGIDGVVCEVIIKNVNDEAHGAAVRSHFSLPNVRGLSNFIN